jgi:hypothetical protein
MPVAKIHVREGQYEAWSWRFRPRKTGICASSTRARRFCRADAENAAEASCSLEKAQG